MYSLANTFDNVRSYDPSKILRDDIMVSEPLNERIMTKLNKLNNMTPEQKAQLHHYEKLINFIRHKIDLGLHSPKDMDFWTLGYVQSKQEWFNSFQEHYNHQALPGFCKNLALPDPRYTPQKSTEKYSSKLFEMYEDMLLIQSTFLKGILQ